VDPGTAVAGPHAAQFTQRRGQAGPEENDDVPVPDAQNRDAVDGQLDRSLQPMTFGTSRAASSATNRPGATMADVVRTIIMGRPGRSVPGTDPAEGSPRPTRTIHCPDPWRLSVERGLQALLDALPQRFSQARTKLVREEPLWLRARTMPPERGAPPVQIGQVLGPGTILRRLVLESVDRQIDRAKARIQRRQPTGLVRLRSTDPQGLTALLALRQGQPIGTAGKHGPPRLNPIVLPEADGTDQVRARRIGKDLVPTTDARKDLLLRHETILPSALSRPPGRSQPSPDDR